MISKDIKKTILILTAQFGAGHISAANAIKDALLEKERFFNIFIQNFITIGAPKMNKPMIKIYENNTKYTPGLYNYYYYLKNHLTQNMISQLKFIHLNSLNIY